MLRGRRGAWQPPGCPPANLPPAAQPPLLEAAASLPALPPLPSPYPFLLLSCFPPCSEEDIDEIQSEIAMLKQCHSPAITAYYGSALVPGTSQLMIAMELMAASAADLVRQLLLALQC